mmetsp:Transcript_26755/g.100615  ORF Transcript_26755/g.100615 Transcript_26755/m.100615 type:complete len:405 (-) Transcript_26755:874-2088(-)
MAPRGGARHWLPAGCSRPGTRTTRWSFRRPRWRGCRSRKPRCGSWRGWARGGGWGGGWPPRPAGMGRRGRRGGPGRVPAPRGWAGRGSPRRRTGSSPWAGRGGRAARRTAEERSSCLRPRRGSRQPPLRQRRPLPQRQRTRQRTPTRGRGSTSKGVPRPCRGSGTSRWLCRGRVGCGRAGRGPDWRRSGSAGRGATRGGEGPGPRLRRRIPTPFGARRGRPAAPPCAGRQSRRARDSSPARRPRAPWVRAASRPAETASTGETPCGRPWRCCLQSSNRRPRPWLPARWRPPWPLWRAQSVPTSRPRAPLRRLPPAPPAPPGRPGRSRGAPAAAAAAGAPATAGCGPPRRRLGQAAAATPPAAAARRPRPRPQSRSQHLLRACRARGPRLACGRHGPPPASRAGP